MDPEDVQLLYGAGKTILFNISELVTLSICYGLYLAVFALSMRSLMQRQHPTAETRIMHIILSILFTSTTFCVATLIAFDVTLIRGAFIENMDLPFLERSKLANQRSLPVAVMANWMVSFGLSSAIVDAVVVWRACVLWPDKNMIKVFLWALLAITFAFSITAGILQLLAELQTPSTSVTVAANLPNDMLHVSLSSTLLTNIVATTMIGVKAHRHWQIMKATIGVEKSKVIVVLFFLAESGTIYCILQAIFLSLQSSDFTPFGFWDYAALIYGSVFFVVSATYPSLIFLVIHYSHSISNYTGTSVNSSFGQDIPGSPEGNRC